MTAAKRPAVDRAVDEIEAVRRFWYPLPAPARLELEALDGDLLQELADSKRLRAVAVDEAVDRLSDAAADRADAIVDRYDPDDREPAGGDPWWAEDPTWQD